MNTTFKYLLIIVLALGLSSCQSSSTPSPQLSFTKAVDYEQPLTIIGGELNYNLLRTISSADTLYGVKFNPSNNTIITYGDSNILYIYSMNLELIKTIKSQNDEILAIDISSDGNYLACSGDDGYVEVWDLKNYTLVRYMQSGSDDIFALSFNSDNTQLASAGEEKVIDIWNVNSGEQIARLEDHQDDIYNLNYIDSNRKIVSSGKDNQTRIWNVNQKRRIYSYLTPSNKYGEIKKAKSFDDYTISALTEVESSEGNSRRRNGPPIWIYTIKFKDNQGNTLFEFDSHRGPITDIAVSNNKSYMASSSEDKTIRLWDLEKKKHITNIVLKDKVNAVSINKSGYLLVALEGNNQLKLFQIKSAHEFTKTKTPLNNNISQNHDVAWYNNQYAIVIGIDHYRRLSLPRLHNAVNDARSVAGLLRKKGFSIIELYNENATKEKILDALKRIKQKSTSKDATLFYFAGHGDGVSGHNNVREGYILPYDFNSDLNSPSTDVMYYDQSALSISSLVMYSRDTPSKHIGIILDSCFSGLAMESKYAKKSLLTASKNLDSIEYNSNTRSVRIKPTKITTTKENINVSNIFKKLLGRKSINILTAGEDKPVSDGSGHSPFTQAFLDVLNADSSNKGYIRFTTLAEYIKKYVEEKTRQQQRPQYKNESLENGDFIFQL